MNSGCSKPTTKNFESFFSLKALQGRGVSFENSKNSYILGIGRIRKSLEYSLENIYYVNGLKFSLLSYLKPVTRATK